MELAPLESAYQSICWGYNEPTEMRCSVETAKRILREISVRTAVRFPWLVPAKLDGLVYNAAKLVLDATMLYGHVRFIDTNSKQTGPGRNTADVILVMEP